jgi:hypothetical protein
MRKVERTDYLEDAGVDGCTKIEFKGIGRGIMETET